MSQSPELAGGEGFTFEGDIVAFYFSALLAEASAPGIDNRIVMQVSVQQRDFGEPLDDVIVDFQDKYKNPARLSLQIKHSLRISKAKTNHGFREIIRDSWATLNKNNFRINIDRYGTAVGEIAFKKKRDLQTLCEWARESLTIDHFNARFANGGSAGKDINNIRKDIVTLLNQTKKAPCTDKEVHSFLSHFVLIQFDFLREGATSPPEAINHLQDCLVHDDEAKAPLIWAKLAQLARSSAGKSGQYNRSRLVRTISLIARLRGATSLRLDLNKLERIARSNLNLISDDIGGTRLERSSILEELDTKLDSSRLLQIHGLPGCGKSVLMRKVVQRSLDTGPVLFFKAGQLEGSSWITYATNQALSSAPLEQLLVEIGATGTPIFFIDAIDRISKKYQPIILDVISTIVKSELLDNWRIVISLRDTGIEMLHNWLSPYLNTLTIETLEVRQLNDDEAEELAIKNPHLRPLLFGSSQVKEIVRRPFFAKVLNQGYVADPNSSILFPQSELDLIENWWSRGGYNESGQCVIERQRTLMELARIHSRQLSQPVSLSKIPSITHIHDLKLDGILQDFRKGVSIHFAHNIFFEWSFFFVLADSGSLWIEEIKTSGEPPAVSRVVELLSQWEYTQGDSWGKYLTQIEESELRSQWLRAWLLGPLGTSKFDYNENQFASTAFANNFHLFIKTLVWFQAEKTTPNQTILANNLLNTQNQRLADVLAWPSDFSTWRRLILFILNRILEIPRMVFPNIVAIFDVWQNATAYFPNPTSTAIKQQCFNWLIATNDIKTSSKPNGHSANWKSIPNLNSFRKSLCKIILISHKADSTLSSRHLLRIADSERIPDDEYQNIIDYSPILAQSIPLEVVNLSLAYLQKELPEEIIALRKQKLRTDSERKNTILSKPIEERTPQENRLLSYNSDIRSIGGFSDYEWKLLSIHNNSRYFKPPSPLREPFHSLFKFSPDEALRLLRELCNHAMNAWRQLHNYSRKRTGTPVPLELQFPWGTQKFWGNDEEYLWFRSTWAPKAIGCGFMALEEWCFAEIKRNKPVDDLIKEIIVGNECIAALGIASVLTLHTQRVSETTLPLITSQRLLAADNNRLMQDFSSSTNLMGFVFSADKPHIEVIRKANSRPVRKMELQCMLPKFALSNTPISNQTREKIFRFKNNLAFQYEEQSKDSSLREQLTAQALRYTELADPENYHIQSTHKEEDYAELVYVSPSASKTENVAMHEEAFKRLNHMGLWTWAHKSFEENAISSAFSPQRAISLAREEDTSNLFECSDDENIEDHLSLLRGAITSTAAVVLSFREEYTDKDLKWARSVIKRATHLSEKTDEMLATNSVIPWHQGIFVARGLAAELREGTGVGDEASNLLKLITNSLEAVSEAAIKEVCNLYSTDPRLTWAGLMLAFSLCHVIPRSYSHPRKNSKALHSSKEIKEAFDVTIGFYKNDQEWPSLPLPPPARVMAEYVKNEPQYDSYREQGAGDNAGSTQGCKKSNIFWNSKQAAKILNFIPLDELLGSNSRNNILNFLTGVLDWTNQKNEPPQEPNGHRKQFTSDIFEWTHTLGSKLGHIAGLIPLDDIQHRFLDPILRLAGDNCWNLLLPFTRTYICTYVYDARIVPDDAIAILDLCLVRLLEDSAFKQDDRSRKFSEQELVRTMMFVSVEKADAAARYVNGDWSEIDRILPLIDTFVRTGGWATFVMDPFLTLCERAKTNYPAETFANQILAIVGEGLANKTNWQRLSIPARISGLVQQYVSYEIPMKQTLAQKFLRILDILVDMGDRRSAALQQSEAFREVSLLS